MKLLLYLFLFTSIFSSNYRMRAPVIRPARPSDAMRIAKRVDHHHTKLVNTQHELIRILGKIPPSKFKPRHIEPITKAIALQNAHPRLKKHEPLIHRSIGQFLKTPGFLYTLQQLFCQQSPILTALKEVYMNLSKPWKLLKVKMAKSY